MAQIPFPEPTIKHCRGCGCQQWFYPHECPIPKVILCWKCRGQEFADVDDEGEQGDEQVVVNQQPVQMALF
jgi:hypothetical protein